MHPSSNALGSTHLTRGLNQMAHPSWGEVGGERPPQRSYDRHRVRCEGSRRRNSRENCIAPKSLRFSSTDFVNGLEGPLCNGHGLGSGSGRCVRSARSAWGEVALCAHAAGPAMQVNTEGEGNSPASSHSSASSSPHSNASVMCAEGCFGETKVAFGGHPNRWDAAVRRERGTEWGRGAEWCTADSGSLPL